MIPNLLPPSHPYCRCMVVPIPDLDLGRFLFDKLKKRVAKIEKRPTIRNLLATVSGVSFAALWQTIQGAEQPSNMLKDFLGNLKNPVNLLGLVGAFWWGRRLLLKCSFRWASRLCLGQKQRHLWQPFGLFKAIGGCSFAGSRRRYLPKEFWMIASLVFSARMRRTFLCFVKVEALSEVLSRLAQRDISRG